MNDEARALLIVAALLSGASGSAGFVGGRMSVTAPPAEVRLIRMPPRVVRIPMVEAAPVEPAADSTEAPAAPVEPPTPVAEPPVSEPVAPVEAKPSPKVEAKPKPQPKAQPKPRPERDAPAKKPRYPAGKPLPSCAVIKRMYDAMSWTERMSEYRSATAEEIAHGKRCLGF